MKLPSFSQRSAEALTPETTPQAAAAVAAAPYATVETAAGVANEVYKATSAASYTRAAANFIAGYTEGMAEFERNPNMSVQELEAMGIDVPVDYVEEVPTEDGFYKSYVPNWAVAEQFHKRLVGKLIDEGVASSKTEAAASRFRTDFTEKYGNEQLLAVQRSAFKQMQDYHATQLFNDVSDMVFHGNYDEAYRALMRGVASDTISQPQFHQAFQDLRQARERAGYIETIETGSLGEQRAVLFDLLDSLENEGRYGGALTPTERQSYINQLQRNIATADKTVSNDSALTYELTRVENGLGRGDSFTPDYLTKLKERAYATGKEQHMSKVDALIRAVEIQQMYRYAAQPELTKVEDKMRKMPLDDPTTAFAREMAVKFSDQRTAEVKADPTGYFLKYGPTNVGDRERNQLLVDAKQDALSSPETFISAILARDELTPERVIFLGREGSLLSRDEKLKFNTIFNAGDMSQKRQALATIGSLPPELAEDVYRELTAVAKADSAIFIAAGQQYLKNEVVNGDLLLTAYSNRLDPQMQKYVSSAPLKQAISSNLANFTLFTGSTASKSMQQAVLTMYSYLAGLQGVDEKSVDVDLLQSATDLALGSSMTDVGRTRLLKVRGKSPEDMNRILRNTTARGWERAFDGVEFATEMNFDALPASIRNGETWFINVPGSTRNVFMIRADNRGIPTLIFDKDGDPVILDFAGMAPEVEESGLIKLFRGLTD